MTSVSLAADSTNDKAIHLSGRWGNRFPIVLGAVSLGLWTWLAFLRPFGLIGLASAALVSAAAYLFFLFATSAFATIHGLTSDTLYRQLARCPACFAFLLMFIPEYASRVRPHTWRSVLMLLLFSALWIALISVCRRQAVSPEKEANRGITLQLIAGLLLFAGLTYIAVRKFYVFGYVGQDLAYFGQIMHTTLHGHLFWGSLLQDLLYSRAVTTDFAGHNSPIMFLFLPFYAVAPSPVTLLILRNVVMLACVIPVFKISRLYSSKGAAALWAIAFLLLPAIIYQSTFDFYPLSFVALPLLFTLLYYLEGRFVPFCVALAFTLLVREDLGLFAIALAGTALLQRKGLRWVATPFVSGAAWAALSYLVVLPHALHGASFVTDACFSHLGKTPMDMLSHVCSSPQTTVLAHGNIVYLKQLLTPSALLLPFASPMWLGSIPFLAINLLAGPGKCITTVIYAQYSVIPTIVLFVSALLSAKGRGLLARIMRLGLENDRVSPLVTIALCLGTLVFISGRMQYDEIAEKPWGEEAWRVAKVIPSGASVAAPRYMLPALANRDCLYQTHRLSQYHDATYEFLILDSDWSHVNASAEYETIYRSLMNSAPADPKYRVIYKSSSYTVLQDPTVHAKGCFPSNAEAAR